MKLLLVITTMVLLSKHKLFTLLHNDFWDRTLNQETVQEYIRALEDYLGVCFVTTKSEQDQLKSELFRLRRQGAMVKSKGGRQFQSFLQRLTGANYNWNVSIDRHQSELKVIEIKCAFDNEISNLKQKNQQLEGKLIETHRHQCKRKSQKNVASQTEQTERKRELKRKPLSDCTHSYAKKRKIQHYKDALSFMEEENTKVLSIVTERDGQWDEIKPDCDKEIEETHMNKLIYILDLFKISKEAYHELSMVFKSLPRSHTIRKVYSRLNSYFSITDTPDGLGVEQSLRARLYSVVPQLIEEKPEVYTNGTILKIKFSADGTRMGKHIHVVNVSFTVLNDSRCGSAQGNYPIAIISTKEKHTELCTALSNLRQETEELQESVITILGVELTIKLYLGGDYKFLLIAAGISSRSIAAKHNCIYCKCSKEERFQIEKEWSLSDKTKGARITYEQSEIVVRGNRKSANFSVTNKALFPNIPLQNVVIDQLHLFLRITDKLFSLLISELRLLDNIKTHTCFHANIDRDKIKHMANLEKQMRDAGIQFEFTVNKDTKKLEYRDLQRPEKLKFMKIFKASELLHDQDRASVIQSIWDGFSYLNNLLKSHSPDVKEVSNLVVSWTKMYAEAYQRCDITPYIHILCYHVPELIQIHGNLVMFTQQGLEKLNDIITKQYFRASNHGRYALKQVLQKQNRITMLETCKRSKEKLVTCGKCKSLGHRRNACPSQEPTSVL